MVSLRACFEVSASTIHNLSQFLNSSPPHMTMPPHHYGVSHIALMARCHDMTASAKSFAATIIRAARGTKVGFAIRIDFGAYFCGEFRFAWLFGPFKFASR